MKSRLALIQKRVVEKTDEEFQELRKQASIPRARIAGVDGVPEEVVYCTRGPRDVVLSGPIEGRGTGPGRVFKNAESAFLWARDKYGDDRVTLIQPHDEVPRWAVMIKNLRK